MLQVFTAVLQTQSVQSVLLMCCCWDLGERNKPELSSGIIRPLRLSRVGPECNVTSTVKDTFFFFFWLIMALQSGSGG